MLSVRFYISAFASFLFIIAVSGSAAQTSIAQSSYPDQLNQQGFELLNSGYPDRAFSVWQEAELLYREEGNKSGIVGSQLNQALSQQSSGATFIACRTLTEALVVSEAICEPRVETGVVEAELSKLPSSAVHTTGLRLLGEGLALLSNLDAAETTLQVAQQQVSELDSEAARLQLALANVYSLYLQESLQAYSRTSVRKAEARENILEQLLERSNQALTHYKTIAASSGPEAVKADLNTVKLLALTAKNGIGLNTRENELVDPLLLAARQAYERLSAKRFEQLSFIDGIYARLGLANDLLDLDQSSYALGNQGLYSEVQTLIEEALTLSEQVGSNSAVSASYGSFGKLRLAEGNLSGASQQYTKAFSLSRSVRADEISYQWAYQLAKINESSGDDAQAEQYYQSAISSLSTIRDNLIAVNSELRFNFRDKVEPVYRDYMRFLSAEAEPELGQIIQVHDSLQLAQLENFLRCGRLISTERSANQALFHVINLGDMLEVVVTRGDESYSYSTPIAELLTAVEGVNINTQSARFLEIPEVEILPYVQQLYNALIRPAEEAGLLAGNIELAFVLDAPFQSVPMALLHDGEQYLAVMHPVSILLQRQSDGPSEAATALFAGLSEAAPSFSQDLGIINATRLQETEYEKGYVEEHLSTQVLLNERFTAAQLDEALSDDAFDTVHISTHGQFGSTPEQTFLVAWDETIDFVELSRLFQRIEGLDLLFLSACQAAAGDDRATLGLAGLAIQSGAQNAIAPLWFQDTTGGSVLVKKFYESLQAAVTPAQALQQAQIFLIDGNVFSHPYYWASFVAAS